MKLLKLACCLVLALSFVACDKDDDVQKDCATADWIGVYEGTIDCDGTEEDVTVTITANGSEEIVISYETITFSVEYDPLNPDNCKIDITESGGGISLSLDATLNGDSFTMTEVFTVSGASTTCEITATRQ